jgi:putative inorganic carbon (hco3(-)) transporter
MLRLIFVVSIMLGGSYYAIQGPFYALLFYLWYAYFRPEQWVWNDFVSSLNLSLITGVFLAIISFFTIQKFRPKAQTVLILIFLLQSALSLATSEHYDWSLGYWIEFAKVLLVALLISLHVNDKLRFRITLIVIGYSVGLEAAKQGWAQLILHPGASNQNTHPVLGDNNGVALAMMMLIPLFIALAQTAKHPWECWMHRFFMVGLLYRGISTYSRGGFLAAGVLGLILLWRSPRKFRFIGVVVILAMMLVLIMPASYWDRMQTINSAGGSDVSTQGRLHFWKVALEMANAKPISGIGFNGFRPSFSAYDTSRGAFGGDRAVHSTWFGILAEMGYPGLLLIVTILLVAIANCRRILRSDRNDSEMFELRAYASALQASLVVFVVGGTFLNAQYSEMFWHFIALGTALTGIYNPAVEASEKQLAENVPVAAGA